MLYWGPETSPQLFALTDSVGFVNFEKNGTMIFIFFLPTSAKVTRIVAIASFSINSSDLVALKAVFFFKGEQLESADKQKCAKPTELSDWSVAGWCGFLDPHRSVKVWSNWKTYVLSTTASTPQGRFFSQYEPDYLHICRTIWYTNFESDETDLQKTSLYNALDRETGVFTTEVNSHILQILNKRSRIIECLTFFQWVASHQGRWAGLACYLVLEPEMWEKKKQTHQQPLSLRDFASPKASVITESLMKRQNKCVSVGVVQSPHLEPCQTQSGQLPCRLTHWKLLAWVQRTT